MKSDKEKVEKIILMLIEQGACLESADREGNTPLLNCCADLPVANAYLLSATRILLEHGADLEARNQQGETPLIITAMNGKVDVLKALIENKADKEARNSVHQTALMLAAEKNLVKVVDELLTGGAFVDSRDENGMTPLMYASYKGNVEVIKMLIQYNSDVSLALTNNVVIVSKTDRDAFASYFFSPYKSQTVIPRGSTALTFAEECGGREVEKALLEAWIKKDPTMERVLIEWRKKVTEF